MTRTFFLLFLALPLFALEVLINTAEEKHELYSVMHLIHDEPFTCKAVVDHFGNTNEIICSFEKRPTNRFTRSENLFFIISSDVRGGQFNIRVTPKKKVQLYPYNHDLKKAPMIETVPKQKSTHWTIIGYETELPFFNPLPSRGINFPISIETHNAPFIGALDIDKRPLIYEDARDVPEYLRAKEMMEDERYEQALFSIDDILKNFPNSIFTKELHLFKIRALSRLEENKDSWDDIIQLGKAWVKKYPSDEHVTEVLMILADTYSKMGFNSESKYYFDRIFNEHAGEKFEKMAKIYLANAHYHKGDTKGALRLYEEALTETKDIEVASLAAFNLAQKLFEKGNVERAVGLYEKVFDANPHFYLKNIESAYKLAQEIAEKESYHFPARLARAVLTKVLKTDDMYEKLIRDIGIWEDGSGNMRRAYTFYKRYLDDYYQGRYYTEIQERMDNLLFAMNENNETKRLNHLDYLMENYADKDISKQALEEKVKILFEQKKYQDVLSFQSRINAMENNESRTQGTSYVIDSATALANQAIAKEDCKTALRYQIDYELTLDSSTDVFMFDCAYGAGLFELASTLSTKNLYEKDMLKRLAWMRKHLKILVHEKKYMDVLKSGNDILETANMLNAKGYEDVLYDMFDAAAMLERREQMIELAAKLEKSFPLSVLNIKPYKTIVNAALNDKNDVMAVDFAQKIMEIQREKNLAEESPWVEFVYMESMIRLKKDDDALSTSKQLLNLDLKPKEQAKTLYLQGFLYQKKEESRNARNSYEQCAAMKVDSPWVKLCGDALKLLP